MFERFTDRARRVMVLAQEEARLLDHTYLGTEHILLGLVHEREGVAATALDGLGITLEAARREVEELVGSGPGAPPGEIPFTPRSQKVFEYAFEEGMEAGHNSIGTEHLLLGLIREGEGVAAHVLEHLGAGLDRVRDAVAAAEAGRPVEAPPDREARMLAELLASERVAELIRGSGADLETLRKALAEDTRSSGHIVWPSGASRSPAHPQSGPGMDAFSHEGQHLLMHANVAAYQHGHTQLAPGHLLLAMFDIATGPVHEAMDGLGVSLTEVRDHVLRVLPPTDVSPTAPLPLTEDCRRVLDAAVAAATARNRPTAGPGHILLALLEDANGLTKSILEDLVGRPSAVKVIVEQAAGAEGTLGEHSHADRDDPAAYKH